MLPNSQSYGTSAPKPGPVFLLGVGENDLFGKNKEVDNHL